MYVSNTVAAPSVFQIHSAQPAQNGRKSSAPDPSGVLPASTGQDGSYDFTSLTPNAFTKNVNELFNAGKISAQDVQVALRLTIKLPGSPDVTQPNNYLEKLRNRIDYDKQNLFAVPGQVQGEQSFLDALTALQGAPKGVDRLA